MDPIGTVLARSGIPAAIEAAQAFLEKLAGPAAEETGLLLADRVREFRLRNQLLAFSGRRKMLAEACGLNSVFAPDEFLIQLWRPFQEACLEPKPVER